MHLLKQSTAATDTVGPILDSAGAEYTGAVIGDLSISKNGTEAAMAAAATLTHISNGMYTLVFTTGNTDTLGRVVVRCNKSTFQMPPVRYEVLAATSFDTLVTNGTLASTTSGRTIVTDAAGLVDANTVKLGPTGAGTAQTARDIGTSVLLSAGTGTGQLDFTSGVVKANATQWVGGTIPAVNVTGVPLVDAKYLLGTIFSTPATAGILDVNLKNIANATVSTSSAQLGVNVVNAGAVAWNSGSITNNTFSNTGSFSALSIIDQGTAQAATGTTIQLRSAAAFADNELNGSLITITSATTGAGQTRTITGYVGSTDTATVDAWTTTPTGTIVYMVRGHASLSRSDMATAIWTDTTAGDFTTALSIGKSIMNGVSLGTGLTVARCTLTDTLTTYTGNTLQTGDSYARIGAAGVGLTSVALADATSDAVIADAVWNAATATYGSAGSYGLLIETDLDATISSRLATSGYTAPSNLTAAQIATGVWQDTTAGDFTTALSIGKSIMNGVTLGTGLTIAAVSGAVGSVTGAVGSVTGNVGGNVTGSVGSIATGGIAAASFAAGAIDASAIAANAIGASELATDAVTEIAAGVWDLATSGHTTSGTFGAAMNAAGSAGDPWATSLPGAYGAGTAGYVVGNGLPIIRASTATGGGSGYILLDASASSTDNFYQGQRITVTGGTGVGQSGIINYYDATGATEGEKAAYLSPTWVTNPDNTSTFSIAPGVVDVEGWLGPRPNNSVAPASSKTSISYPKIDIARANGTNVSATSGYLAVDTQRWLGEVIPATAQTGVPKVDVRYLLGTAWLTPAVAGTPDVNTKTFVSTLDFTATMKTSIPTAVGLASANLDTQLGDLPTNAELATAISTGLATYDAPTHAEMTAELATADDAVLAAIAALNNVSTANVSTAVTTALTTAIAETYRATGSTGSVAQLLYEILGNLINFANSGTLRTVTKLNQTQTAKTYTYDSASAPTAVEETT